MSQLPFRLAPACAAAAIGLAMAWAGCGDGKPGEAAAGEMRRELVEMADGGQATVRADLDVALGNVTAGRAEAGTLFQAEIDLPADGLTHTFDATTTETESGPQARVTLGLAGEPARFRDLGGTLNWRIYFAPDRPLDLSLDLGAASADLDLGGVPVRRLTLHAGVARTRLAFGAPNPEPLRLLDVTAGVGEVTLDGLGNARFERLAFAGGVGRYRLDFSGEAFVPGAEATVEVGVATLDLVLPRDAPVVLDAPSSRISSVEVPAGFVTLGDGRYATPGAEDDRDALRLRVRSGPGRTRVTFAE